LAPVQRAKPSRLLETRASRPPSAGQFGSVSPLDLAAACAYMCTVETQTGKIKRRLEKGRVVPRPAWFQPRHYRHQDIREIITLPRHRTLSPGVARSIARKAQWPDDE